LELGDEEQSRALRLRQNMTETQTQNRRLGYVKAFRDWLMTEMQQRMHCRAGVQGCEVVSSQRL
jgi:hypothetical protein